MLFSHTNLLHGWCALLLLTATLWVDPAHAQPVWWEPAPGGDVRMTDGCTVLQAGGFTSFSSSGHVELSSSFSLKNNRWAQEKEYGVSLFKMTDGYWYIGTNPPLNDKDRLDSDLGTILGFSAAEALFPTRQIEATISSHATLPPSSGWKSIKAQGLEVAEPEASFTCTCNLNKKFQDISGCPSRTSGPIVIGITLGLCAFVFCLALSVIFVHRWTRHVSQHGRETHFFLLPVDLEAGQPNRSTTAESKICPKTRAEHALKIIETADEGMLWVGYVKPTPNLRTSEEKFAPLRWVKSAEMKTHQKEDYLENDPVCCVCLDKAPSCKLLPCQHQEFCAACIVENACRWCKGDAPECPICRVSFHTIMLPLPPEAQASLEHPNGALPNGAEQHHATAFPTSCIPLTALPPASESSKVPVVILSSVHMGEILTQAPLANDSGTGPIPAASGTGPIPAASNRPPFAYSIRTRSSTVSGYPLHLQQSEYARGRISSLPDSSARQGFLSGDIVYVDEEALDTSTQAFLGEITTHSNAGLPHLQSGLSAA